MSQSVSNPTPADSDDVNNAKFFDYVDQLIQQANALCSAQVGEKINPKERRAQVSAAILFAAARFNTWATANTFKDGQEMQEHKDQVIAYLVQQFQSMLADNYDEYCEQFDSYLRYRKMEEFHSNKP